MRNPKYPLHPLCASHGRPLVKYAQLTNLLTQQNWNEEMSHRKCVGLNFTDRISWAIYKASVAGAPFLLIKPNIKITKWCKMRRKETKLGAFEVATCLNCNFMSNLYILKSVSREQQNNKQAKKARQEEKAPRVSAESKERRRKNHTWIDYSQANDKKKHQNNNKLKRKNRREYLHWNVTI